MWVRVYFMKKLVLILLLLLPNLTQAKDFFPEVDDELEATQFWASPYFKPGSNVAVMNFRVWFKYPADKVFRVLTDTMSFKAKMNNYTEARTLTKNIFKEITDAAPQTPEAVIKIIGTNRVTSFHNREKGANWNDYIFLQFNFPWPLTDRWTVQRMKFDETNANKGEYKLDYKMEIGNFKALFGSWELVPIPNHPGWTEFRGRYESDPGIPVPKFITKTAMKTGLKKDVDGYRRILGGK